MNNDQLEILLTREQISERVAELADAISRDYGEKRLLLVCVLKGAIVFLADLMRNLTVQHEIDFVVASSYDRDKSTGVVNLSPLFSDNIKDKHVLIVEDIIDTGRTSHALQECLMAHGPASLKLCSLLDKPARRLRKSLQPDYCGFTIPDRFVVGYGLDYDGRYRELPDICALMR